MKNYMHVTVAPNKKYPLDIFSLQEAVDSALQAHFPSYEADGGCIPACLWPGDVYFSINYRSVNKVVPYLKKIGFKVV